MRGRKPSRLMGGGYHYQIFHFIYVIGLYLLLKSVAKFTGTKLVGCICFIWSFLEERAQERSTDYKTAERHAGSSTACVRYYSYVVFHLVLYQFTVLFGLVGYFVQVVAYNERESSV